MAKPIFLRHRESGLTRTAYYGFSWTTLIFGSFPALFRGDYLTFVGSFVIFVILAAVSYGLLFIPASIVWAFLYNKYHGSRLLERGYEFADTEGRVAEAKSRWRIVDHV
ncbi:MAG: hypothetical protein ACKOC1_02025 [Hyphomicrobiales bacterium]